MTPAQVFAQAPTTQYDDERCLDPEFAADPANAALCTRTVGGSEISAESIRQAINSPTPNLANTTAYVFYTISILLTGTFDPSYAGEQASVPVSTFADATDRGGALGGIGFLMGQLVANPPASAQYYMADLVNNARFTGSPVYAQGIGFGALNPILGTWKAFRDVAYYLLTIMFLVTGFLILIRHKISGNVAVTVQNALPKLVITLILITFSYAIAGLVVDIMFLALFFIISIFGQYIFLPDANFATGALMSREYVGLSEIAFNTHIFEFMVGFIFSGTTWKAAQSVGQIMTQAIGSFPLLDVIAGQGSILRPLFNEIINVFIVLILAIALFIAMIRTFFSLIMSYAGFVINVVLSPFILLVGAVPGKDPWKNWIKNLIAGLAPFVVAIFMIFMSLALTGQQTRDGIGYKADGGQVEGLRLPLITGGVASADAFIGILAMGFMLLMPEAVKMTKKFMQVSGGIFEEQKDAALANFKQGVSGNKYVPGAGKVAKGAAISAGLGLAGGTAGAIIAGKNAYASSQAEGHGRFRSSVNAALKGTGGGLAGGFAGATAYPAATMGAPVVRNVKKGVEYVKKFDSPAADLLRALELNRAKQRAQQKGAEEEQQVSVDKPEVDTF